MHRPRQDKDYLPIDAKFDSTSDSDTDTLYDGSDDERVTEINTGLDGVLEEIDSNTDDNDLFDDEVRHLPEYYLAAESNLDVGRLRQKRYSPKTQMRLDWVKDHHHQYGSNIDRLY